MAAVKLEVILGEGRAVRVREEQVDSIPAKTQREQS
jgi:hypothetical protein